MTLKASQFTGFSNRPFCCCCAEYHPKFIRLRTDGAIIVKVQGFGIGKLDTCGSGSLPSCRHGSPELQSSEGSSELRTQLLDG